MPVFRDGDFWERPDSRAEAEELNDVRHVRSHGVGAVPRGGM